MSIFAPANIGIIGLDPVAAEGFNPESYGADPNASASLNTTAIQAALNAANTAGGGTITLQQPGVYQINSVLTIYSNTRLSLGSGVTIKQAASSFNNMIVNSGYTASTTTVTLSWSALATCTVNWTAHGKSVGQYVSLQGATPWQFVGVFRISSITNVNSFVIDLWAIPSSSPSGTIVAKIADENIIIEGGEWDYNQANNNGAQSATQKHAIILGHCVNSHLRDIEVNNALKYCVNIGAAVNCTIKNYTTNVTASDGIKVYGPTLNCGIDVASVQTVDDCISFQARETDAFATSRWVFGPILNNFCYNVVGAGTSSGRSMVQVYSTANYRMSGLDFRNFTKTSATTKPVIGITADGGTGDIGTLSIDGVHGAGTSISASSGVFLDTCGTIEKLSINNLDVACYVGVLDQTSGTVKELILSQSTHNPVISDNQLLNLQAITTESIIVQNCVFISTVPAGGNYAIILKGGTHKKYVHRDNVHRQVNGRAINILTCGITSVVMDGNSVEGGDNFLIVGASVTGTPQFTYCNNDTTTTAVFNCASQSNVNFIGNRMSGATNGVVRTNGNVTLSIRSDGANFLASGSWVVVPSGTPVLTVYGWDIAIDPITLTGLATTLGQFFYSTQAGAEGGPSVRSNAGWYNLAGGAAGANQNIT